MTGSDIQTLNFPKLGYGPVILPVAVRLPVLLAFDKRIISSRMSLPTCAGSSVSWSNDTMSSNVREESREKSLLLNDSSSISERMKKRFF